MVSEKRKFPRGPIMLPVNYVLNQIPREGYITDLSQGGCRFYCYSPVKIRKDEPVEISLRLKNWEDAITLKAQITRLAPYVYNPGFNSRERINYEMGLRFLKPSKIQKEAINSYIRMVLERIKKGQPEE